jgi:hypothetical protein
MFVILVILVNLAGKPAVIGEYNQASYPTLEACEAARPTVVAAIDESNKEANLKVGDSKCATREDADKLRALIENKKDNSI